MSVGCPKFGKSCGLCVGTKLPTSSHLGGGMKDKPLVNITIPFGNSPRDDTNGHLAQDSSSSLDFLCESASKVCRFYMDFGIMSCWLYSLGTRI